MIGNNLKRSTPPSQPNRIDPPDGSSAIFHLKSKLPPPPPAYPQSDISQPVEDTREGWSNPVVLGIKRLRRRQPTETESSQSMLMTSYKPPTSSASAHPRSRINMTRRQLINSRNRDCLGADRDCVCCGTSRPSSPRRSATL